MSGRENIKFVGKGLTDMPFLIPIMKHMGIKEIYTDNNPVATTLGLVPISLSQLNKENIIVSCWGGLMKELELKGFNRKIFTVHGACNYCGCLANMQGTNYRWELVAGPMQRNFRVRSGKKSHEVIVTGFPKTDPLAKNPGIDHLLRKKIMGNDKKTVLWAPPGHEDYVNKYIGIMEKIAINYDINVICKLHAGGRHLPLFKGKLQNEHIRIVWDDEYTTVPLMQISDILVSGHSSVPFEFTITDRPIISSALYSHDLINDHTSSVEVGLDKLESTIIGSLDNPGKYVNLAEREKLRDYTFSYLGTATEKTVEQIDKISNVT